MLKEYDPPKEPVRIKAERRWKNNELTGRLTAEKHRPKLVDPNKEPEMAETIVNESRRDGPVKRFESRFIKEIRMTLSEHKLLNLKIYAAAIEHRRRILLKEKLRRLKLAQQDSEMKEVGHDESV
jgi:hypothetical protein